MKKIKIALFTLFFGAISIHAQDIKGVDCSMMMTESQVVSKFGKPEKFEQKFTASGFHEIYHYYSDSFIIEFCDSYLDNFIVEKSGIAILTKYIPGGIQVGDNISKVSSSDVNVRQSIFQSGKNDEIMYDIVIKGVDGYSLYAITRNSKITCLSFFVAY